VGSKTSTAEARANLAAMKLFLNKEEETFQEPTLQAKVEALKQLESEMDRLSDDPKIQ
jgi:hypothetical protein